VIGSPSISRHRLDAICQLLDDYSMVSFCLANMTDEESGARTGDGRITLNNTVVKTEVRRMMMMSRRRTRLQK
jgi:hypothetical protein